MLQVCDEVRKLQKVGVKRHHKPLASTTGIKYRSYDPAFGLEQQMELLHRCQSQEWVGVCDVKFVKLGRGLVSLQKIQKDDVVVDYHGLVVEGVTMEKYVEKEDVKSEYCMEISHKPKRIIDATAEHCLEHPGNRCLGRLANHALLKNGVANMVISDIELNLITTKPRVVVLQARTDIEPFQQLRFDYTDKVARKLFKDSS